MNYSDAQKQVIEAEGQNLLVSAAAGSGKTTVLVERVLHLLEKGTNVDEILVVTFTRAASADMRRKLFERLVAQAQNPGCDWARNQLERLEFASISTLHSFCTGVIRANFELADVDPGFTVAEATESDLMQETALGDALESAYAADGEGMEALCRGRGPEEVACLCRRLFAKLSERPDPEKWFENALSLMEGDGSAWCERLLQEARGELTSAKKSVEYELSRLSLPGAPAYLRGTLEKDLEIINGLLEADYDGLTVLAGGVKFSTKPRTPSKGDDVPDPDFEKEIVNARDEWKAKVKAAFSSVSLPSELSMQDIREDVPAFKKLYEIATDAAARFDAAKRERGVLTFNDLEHLTRKILTDEDARRRVRAKYKYVFVDEYQDTSDIQDEIVSLVAGENNRFMVGDMKQSIYRFRSAEPSLFMDKYELYAKGGINRLIVLKENYRSKRSVIDLTNLVFKSAMHGGVTEITYDEDACLHPGREESYYLNDAPAELNVIASDGTEDVVSDEAGDGAAAPDEDAADLKDCEREALLVAKRIREMMTADSGLSYKDFCVIARSGKNVLPRMAAVLAQEGIPSFADGSGSYFDAIEVVTVLSVLKLLVSRRHDVELLCVLRSPMFGMTSTMLAEMRVKTPEGSLWEAVEAYAADNENAALFLFRIKAWKEYSRVMSLNHLIRRILADTDFYACMGALPGGKTRQGNLDLLCQYAMEFEHSRGSSIGAFLRLMEERGQRGDGSEAHELGENDDVVRLMTAHKSKGLQFKIVFAVMLSKSYDKKGAADGEPVFFDKKLGGGFRHADTVLGTKRDTLLTRAVEAENKRRERAEELRILYVTLTRAESRIILIGSVKDFAKSRESWASMRRDPDTCKSSLDVIASAVSACPGSDMLGGDVDVSLPTVVTRVIQASSLAVRTEETEGREAALNAILAFPEGDPALAEAMDWVYPFKDAPGAPLKIAVTGLDKKVTGGDTVPQLRAAPAFISGENRNIYTDRGTAVHMALRKLDYAPFAAITDTAAAREEAARQIALLRDKNILTAEETALINPAHVGGFALSDLGRRAAAAETCKREWSFSLRVPAPRFMPEVHADTELFVQGCIDLCFLENGKWILADYKTERSDDDEALLARYGRQLDMYAEALETLTGIPVDKAYICLVAQGRTVEAAINRG